jgi:hypothetical protein
MPPLHRDYLVIGPYTLKGGKLTFPTGAAALAFDARQAMADGRDFSVSITQPEGLKVVNGKVLSVDLVEGVKPAHWEIVIRGAS